jgi:hypothetical protein
MQVIIKVLGIFVGLFVIVNGVATVLLPPTGDEPLGYLIIIAGFLIPVIIFFFDQLSVRRKA